MSNTLTWAPRWSSAPLPRSTTSPGPEEKFDTGHAPLCLPGGLASIEHPKYDVLDGRTFSTAFRLDLEWEGERPSSHVATDAEHHQLATTYQEDGASASYLPRQSHSMPEYVSPYGADVEGMDWSAEPRRESLANIPRVEHLLPAPATSLLLPGFPFQPGTVPRAHMSGESEPDTLPMIFGGSWFERYIEGPDGSRAYRCADSRCRCSKRRLGRPQECRRHAQGNQHAKAGRYPCSWEGCEHVARRKDKLWSHQRAVHDWHMEGCRCHECG